MIPLHVVNLCTKIAFCAQTKKSDEGENERAREVDRKNQREREREGEKIGRFEQSEWE